MSDIKFNCSHCNHSLMALTDKSGAILPQQVVCPSCKTFVLPPASATVNNEHSLPSSIGENISLTYSNFEADYKKTKACYYCGEQILLVAIKCKHCGEFVDDINSNRELSIKKQKNSTIQNLTVDYVTTQSTFKRYKATRILSFFLIAIGFITFKDDGYLLWIPAIILYLYSRIGTWWNNH